jgi:uncharacterized protein
MNYEKTGNPLHDDIAVTLGNLQSLAARSGWRMLPADSLHGFLTAVAIGPRMAPPSVWLPRVFFDDKQLPEFKDEKEARTVIQAILNIYASVMKTLVDETFAPLASFVVEDDMHVADLSMWCAGFVLGTCVFAPDEWDMFNDDELAELCLPIFFYSKTDRLSEIYSPAQLKRMEDRAEQAGDLIIDAVYDIQEYFSDLEASPTPAPEQRAQPKVGRNEPCPCGSGKKFKKCCGGKE